MRRVSALHRIDRRPLASVAAAAWAPSLLAGLWVYAPFAGRGVVSCAFRIVSGVPCPGCGMTRALGELTHGRVASSLYFHPLSIPTVVGIVVVWVYGMVGSRRRVNPITSRFVLMVLTPLSAVFLLVWVARMVLFLRAGGIPPEFGRPTWGG